MGWCIKWGLRMLAAVMSLPAISLAAIEVRVDSKAGIQKISPYIFGKNISGLNDAETSDPAKIAAEDSTVKRMNEIGFRFFRANNGNNATRYNWRKKLTVHPDWYNNVYAHDWDITAKTIQDKLPGANAMYAFQLSGYADTLAQINAGTATGFTAATKDMIFFAYTAVPGILALLSIIPMFKYDIVGEKKQKISKALQQRRGTKEEA